MTSPRRISALIAPALLVSTLAIASEARAVVIDFDTAADYTANFQRTFITIGSNNASGHSAGTQTYTHTATGSGTAAFVYDTIPDATATNTFAGDVTVEFDFSTTVSNVSFGVYFGGSSRANTNLAIFNINMNSGATPTSNDTLRFFTGGSLNSGAAGTQSSISTLTNGGWTTNTTYHATLSIDYVTGTTANVTYTITDPSNTLSSFSATATGLTVASAGEIGFRTGFSTAGGTLTFDNISISQIPEPSAFAAFGGLAALGFAALRRRRA